MLRQDRSAEQESRRIKNEALKTAESKKREALLEAKEEVQRAESSWKEIRIGETKSRVRKDDLSEGRIPG